MPYEFKHEEKIIGGYLSLKQLLYLVAAACSLALLMLPIWWPVRIIIALIPTVFFTLCAFLSIGGIGLDTFLITAVKFYLRNKDLKYERN